MSAWIPTLHTTRTDKSRGTHKTPNPKSTTTAIFCLRGKRNTAHMGMGKTTIHRSVTICNAALRNHTGVLGKQRCKLRGLQKSATGTQNSTELRIIHGPRMGITTRLVITMMR